MVDEITNNQDYISMSDVHKRIDELESELECLTDAVTEAEEAYKEAQEARVGYTDADDLAELQSAVDEAKEALEEAKKDLIAWEGDEDTERCDEAIELEQLKELADECDSDATLIRETAFEDYARQLAEDLGFIANDQTWPATCTDWDEATNVLKQDYTCVEFGDITYYTSN